MSWLPSAWRFRVLDGPNGELALVVEDAAGAREATPLAPFLAYRAFARGAVLDLVWRAWQRHARDEALERAIESIPVVDPKEGR